MSTTTTTITTNCDCTGSGKYSIQGPGGTTHPPGTNLTITPQDLVRGLSAERGSPEYAIASLLLGGLYLNAAESLPEGALRARLAAHGFKLLEGASGPDRAGG